ncbi:hypothetical protein B0H14DRAFT_1312224 [Mycena olivaceomarginata]|nr:hypothetical protein B0H14DRAFT_1312224 [Mycena olivaceomarginata]
MWNLVLDGVLFRSHVHLQSPQISPVICLVINTFVNLLEAICVNWYIHHHTERRVVNWIENSLRRHKTPVGAAPDRDIGMELSSPGQDLTVLSGNESPMPSVPQALSALLCHHRVLYWDRLCGDPGRRKLLWITDDQHNINACASGVFHLLSAAPTTLSVDVSDTALIHPHLVQALWTLCPEYKQQVHNDMWSINNASRFKSHHGLLIGRLTKFLCYCTMLWKNASRFSSSSPTCQPSLKMK